MDQLLAASSGRRKHQAEYIISAGFFPQFFVYYNIWKEKNWIIRINEKQINKTAMKKRL